MCWFFMLVDNHACFSLSSDIAFTQLSFFTTGPYSSRSSNERKLLCLQLRRCNWIWSWCFLVPSFWWISTYGCDKVHVFWDTFSSWWESSLVYHLFCLIMVRILVDLVTFSSPFNNIVVLAININHSSQAVLIYTAHHLFASFVLFDQCIWCPDKFFFWFISVRLFLWHPLPPPFGGVCS